MAQYGFGSGLMFGTRTDIANPTPRLFGTLQEGSVDFSGDTKQLFGMSQFPVDVARAKMKIEGKAKLGQISAAVFNDLFFAETSGATLHQIAYLEAKTIPGTPFQVTATNTTGFSDRGAVYAATGVPFILVASAPAAGQYSVTSGGVYTFAAVDTGAAVLISYAYTAATGGYSFTITNKLMGNTPTFRLDLNMQFRSKQMLLRLNACVSSKLGLSTKQDDYVIPEFDFEAFADAANNIGTFSVADIG